MKTLMLFVLLLAAGCCNCPKGAFDYIAKGCDPQYKDPMPSVSTMSERPQNRGIVLASWQF